MSLKTTSGVASLMLSAIASKMECGKEDVSSDDDRMSEITRDSGIEESSSGKTEAQLQFS